MISPHLRQQCLQDRGCLHDNILPCHDHSLQSQQSAQPLIQEAGSPYERRGKSTQPLLIKTITDMTAVLRAYHVKHTCIPFLDLLPLPLALPCAGTTPNSPPPPLYLTRALHRVGVVLSGSGCDFPPRLFTESPRAEGVFVERLLLIARVVVVAVVVCD